MLEFGAMSLQGACSPILVAESLGRNLGIMGAGIVVEACIRH